MLQTETNSLLTIDPEILKKVQDAAASDQSLVLNDKIRENLRDMLQAAIKLEHCTIPVYLTALYSVQQGSNADVYKIIRSVVREEMLHMVIAANVLNAIGGSPVINKPGFIPKYPGYLPKIDMVEVNLAPLSMDVVSHTFMKIEKPEKPILIPFSSSLREEILYPTIGAFYQAIIDVLQKGGQSWIIGKADRQVVNPQWFPSDELFAIKTVEDAVKALNLIMQQGEGTKISPEDPENDYAHYYRFEQIDKGHYLVINPEDPHSWSFTGPPISLDTTKVWNLVKNSKAAYYKPGSVARRMVDEFNYSYTSLLNGLHKTFNGEPNYLNTVMGSMFEIKLQAERMVERKIGQEELDFNELEKGFSPQEIEDIKKKIKNQEVSVTPSFEYALKD